MILSYNIEYLKR